MTSGEAAGAVRRSGLADDDGVVAALVSSTLFDDGDEPMLRSLLAEHRGAGQDSGQRWIVATAGPDGEVVGTALYRPVEAADRVWDLTMIGVRAQDQGQGVGRRLMGHVEQELQAEGQRRVVVQTSGLERFAATRAFYRGLGYVECGRVPDYWAEGDTMVLFSKPLGARPVPAQNGMTATHDHGTSAADRPDHTKGVTVRSAGMDELPALKPLWLQLHHHHQAGLPEFHGFVTDDERSWSVRHATYRGVLEQEQGFVLVAERGDVVVGYTAVAFTDGAADTFDVGEQYAEVLTLVVDTAERGTGIGGLLLDAVDERLATLGVVGLAISVMHGNDGARRFYERRGLVAAETYLWRTADRGPTPARDQSR